MASPVPSTVASESTHRAQRRQAIVEAAARLFATEGYSGCEMERVAADLKIAKGTLYLYFAGKQELFFACVDWGMQQMQHALRIATENCPEPFQRIARAIRAYLAFFEEHPHYVELLIQERAIFKDRVRPTYFASRDANRGPWREFYQQLVTAGHLRDDIPVERMLDTLGNLVYGTMFTNHFVGRTVSLDEQFTGIMEIVFRGLFSEDERKSREGERLGVQSDVF
ncbi:MAG: TetR/AcrR family transcriptional regulator [Planctomycetota bacterium]|nr:TetR/AcrR family transcriptional regulator [Planctomycetota bacterium]